MEILQYPLNFESGKSQLEQTKFPVFWPNFHIPSVFPDREYFWPFSLFSLFSLCHGYPATTTQAGYTMLDFGEASWSQTTNIFLFSLMSVDWKMAQIPIELSFIQNINVSFSG